VGENGKRVPKGHRVPLVFFWRAAPQHFEPSILSFFRRFLQEARQIEERLLNEAIRCNLAAIVSSSRITVGSLYPVESLHQSQAKFYGAVNMISTACVRRTMSVLCRGRSKGLCVPSLRVCLSTKATGGKLEWPVSRVRSQFVDYFQALEHTHVKSSPGMCVCPRCARLLPPPWRGCSDTAPASAVDQPLPPLPLPSSPICQSCQSMTPPFCSPTPA